MTAHDLLSRQLGVEWKVVPKTVDELESFTCPMYGHPRDTSVNEVRGKLLKKMVGEDHSLNSKSKVDLVRLPPCQDSLIPHIQRVNHRVACYKRAVDSLWECPRPYDEGQGWQKTEDGMLEPIWSIGPILPESLIDLLDDDGNQADCNQDTDVEDVDIELEYNEDVGFMDIIDDR